MLSVLVACSCLHHNSTSVQLYKSTVQQFWHIWNKDQQAAAVGLPQVLPTATRARRPIAVAALTCVLAWPAKRRDVVGSSWSHGRPSSLARCSLSELRAQLRSII